jgi:aspartokinase
MVTVSYLVKAEIEGKPLLQETLRQGIINYAALAEKLKPRIERELGRPAKESAIIMALRRHAEQLNEKKLHKKVIALSSEIIMKTNLIDISVYKSPQLFKKLEQLYRTVSYEKGDTLNIIHGNYEVSIITNNRYKDKVLTILKEEKMLNIEEHLVSLSLQMNKEFLYTPGVLFTVIRKLAWENINIFEVISTATEMTFILNEKDTTRAYNLLQELVRK